ncbi:MAG: Rpn family recombination-promoting nuclease/putative transposase [Lachnospiraceae bacterium]|nr:Rpn family recombination-promoting nuclease/putative transposase [Lachnospiraceae bacterium]
MTRDRRQIKKEQKVMKPLKELNLLDRFLFDEVMEDPQTAQDILEILLGREVLLLDHNETEKEYRRSPQYRSIRIDVFALDAEGNIYDAEMQGKNTGKLPRRSRLYESHFNVSLLAPGETDFNKLNDVYVIIIAPFDLWGMGRYRYTFRMGCEEVPGLHLEDGATRIFLNTRGTEPDGVSRELVDFLHYVEDSSLKGRDAEFSEKLSRIHDRVQRVKESKEVGVKYMQRWEELAYAKAEAREEGLQRGIEQGRKEERVNTEQERKRAEHAEKELEGLRKELEELRKRVAEN